MFQPEPTFEIRFVRFMFWSPEGRAVFAVRASQGDYMSEIDLEELTPMLHSLREIAPDPRHPLYQIRYEIEAANAAASPFHDPVPLPIPLPQGGRAIAPPDWAIQSCTRLPYAFPF